MILPSDDAMPDLIVIGAGMAGLVAANRAVRADASVLVLEAGRTIGGMLRPATLGGVRIDIGAEAFATRGAALDPLLAELGLDADVVEPNQHGSWGYSDGTAYPLPKGGMLGIPADPLDDDARAILGEEAAQRAAADLELGPEAGMNAEHLADFVAARMGQIVVDRLVTPVCRGVYSLDARELDHRVLVPGLECRLQEEGSLQGAIRAMRRGGAPGAAVRGIAGGMHRIPERLAEAIRARGGEIRFGDPVRRIVPQDDTWRVELMSGGSFEARNVIATVPVDGAIAPGTDVEALTAGPVAETVALRLRAPELDVAPCGTGILVGEPAGEVAAKAATHASAKWPWIAEALEEGEHIVRFSYPPREGEGMPLTAGLDNDALRTRALTDLALLFGIEVQPESVCAMTRQTWHMPAPGARLGRSQEVAGLRVWAEDQPGLALAGTWIDGTGLANVVPGAERAALRHLGR